MEYEVTLEELSRKKAEKEEVQSQKKTPTGSLFIMP